MGPSIGNKLLFSLQAEIGVYILPQAVRGVTCASISNTVFHYKKEGVYITTGCQGGHLCEH